MLTRHWFMAALAVATTALPAPAAFAQPARPKITSVQAGDGLQFLTQHLAIRAGYFAEEGFDIETADVGSGPRVVAALMGGSAVFSSLGPINLLNVRKEGGDLVAVAMESSIIDIQIVLSNDAIKKTGIDPKMPIDEKIRRLRDVRIAVTSPGSSTDTMLRSLLLARGVDPNKALKILPMGGGSNMLAALEKNGTDGFAWGAPHSLLAVAHGAGQIVIDPFTGEVPEIKDVPYIVVTTSRDTLKRKPEMIRATVRALTKAMKLARDKPEEAKKLVRLDFADVPEAIFDAAWANYRQAIPTTPVIPREQFEKTKTWLNISSSAPVTVKYEDAIVSDDAVKAAAEILGK
jgi:NitT/TauT family transport system substrate-binding protein